MPKAKKNNEVNKLMTTRIQEKANWNFKDFCSRQKSVKTNWRCKEHMGTEDLDESLKRIRTKPDERKNEKRKRKIIQ